MFPFVPSNSLLHLVRPQAAELRPGDIVCYPGARKVIAHRVVRVEQGPRGRVFVTRGDAMRAEERVEEPAIAYVVRRVEHRWFAYDVDGWFGRAASDCALRGGLGLRVVTGLGRAVVKLRQRLVRAPAAKGEDAPGMPDASLSTSVVPASPVASEVAEGMAGASPSGPPERSLSSECITSPLTRPPDADIAPPAAAGTSATADLAGSTKPQVVSSETPDGLLRLLNHELRTPLNGILGFVEVLLGELDGPLLNDERENLALVRDAGRQLLAIVSEVLDLVAAVATEGEEVRETIDLVEVLEAERTVLEERRGLRPVYVRVDVAPEAATLWADRSDLVRVLRALGELAIDATVSGQVSLEALASDGQVRLRVRWDGLVLQVSPAAPGSVPAAAERPSSPADRLASPGERDDRLRRLRLEMVRRLAERALGRLEVSMTPTGSELVLWMVREGSKAERAPASRSDIPLAVRYLAATGHDLRTPLNAILGFSDLVAMQQDPAWTPSQHKSLAIVRERARDLAWMVDDMIDWAKLEVGDMRLALHPHDAAELLERAAAVAIEHSGERGLRVDLELAPGLGMLCVDGDRFVQAMVGLMDDAARATPAPTVKLRAMRMAATAEGPASLRLEVTDPGLQIRIEDRAHIFAAFRPSFAPTGQRVAGLHLGTSVARALLRAHGGDVWFESRPNQGTTFVASLPEACLA